MRHTISNLIVEVSPGEVDAAAELTLSAQVMCTPALDLRGHTLLIADHAGAVVDIAKLVEFDGEINSTGLVVLNAPVKLGSYSWSFVCPAKATEVATFDEIAESFTVIVKPHTTRIVVWDVPSAVVVGEKFRFKVGLKCSGACRLERREFDIIDGSGAHIATGSVGSDTWPGSTALYYTEVEVEAPHAAGHDLWEVKAPASAVKVQGSEIEIAHEERSEPFLVRSVLSPESLVSVKVIDKEHQSPLNGASVVMYPYRAITDDHGVAKMRVTKGQYRLQVSRSKHLASNHSIEVRGDITVRAELDRQPEMNPDDRYI